MLTTRGVAAALMLCEAAGLVESEASRSVSRDARVAVWRDTMSDMDDTTLLAAVREHIRRSKYMPTPADLLAIDRELRPAPAGVPWHEVVRAYLRAGGRHATPEALAAVPAAIDNRVAMLGGWEAIREACDEEGGYRLRQLEAAWPKTATSTAMVRS